MSAPTLREAESRARYVERSEDGGTYDLVAYRRERATPPEDPRAGLAAFGFHVAAVCFSNRFLTDGRVQPDELGLIFPGVTKTAATKLARRLVDAGLWEEDGARWLIHDFLKYNPSAAEVRQDREAARARQQSHRQRLRGLTSLSQNGSHCDSHAVTPSGVTPGVRVPRSGPSRSGPSRSETALQGAGAETPPAEAKSQHPVAETPIRQAVKHWAAGWTKLRGEEPPMLWPRMCGQIAPIMKACGLERTKHLLDRFFASEDQLVTRSDYSVGAFVQVIYRLAGTPNGHSGLSERERELFAGLANAATTRRKRPTPIVPRSSS